MRRSGLGLRLWVCQRYCSRRSISLPKRITSGGRLVTSKRLQSPLPQPQPRFRHLEIGPNKCDARDAACGYGSARDIVLVVLSRCPNELPPVARLVTSKRYTCTVGILFIGGGEWWPIFPERPAYSLLTLDRVTARPS